VRTSRMWLGGAVAATGIVLGLGGAATARAQAAITFPMTVTENRAPGAAGNVTVTPLSATSARIDIRITGLQPNSEHAAHIHTAPGARCDNGAPVTYPLTNVRVDANGVGTSSTTVTITPDKPVQVNNAYVNVHEAATPPGNGIICANVTSPLTATVAQPGGQRPGGAVATPAAQRPAAPAAPAAPRPAAPAAPAALPRTGAGAATDRLDHGTMLAALAAVALLISGTGVLTVARRRR